jgi:hypothetical protein
MLEALQENTPLDPAEEDLLPILRIQKDAQWSAQKIADIEGGAMRELQKERLEKWFLWEKDSIGMSFYSVDEVIWNAEMYGVALGYYYTARDMWVSVPQRFIDFLQNQKMIDEYFLITLSGYLFPKRNIMPESYINLRAKAVLANASEPVIREIENQIPLKHRTSSTQK